MRLEQTTKGVGTCLVALLLAACGGGSASSAGTTSGTINVGGLFEQTGSAQAFGVPAAEGTQLAIKEINAAGGVLVGGTRYKINMNTQDTQTDANVGVSKAAGMIRDNGIQYMFGPISGLVSGPVAQVTQQNGIIQLSPASILQNSLTPATVTTTAKGLFMTQASDLVREGVNAQAFSDVWGSGSLKVALLARNDANGQFISGQEAQALKNKGYDVAPTYFYPPGTTDYRSLLARIKDTNPDILDIWYVPTDALVAVTQAIQLGVAKKGYSVALTATSDIVKAVGTNVSVPILAEQSPITPDIPSTPAIKKFFADLQKDNPGPFSPAEGAAAWFYTSVYMLAAAWKAAGTVTDIGKVEAALAKGTYSGILGEEKFDNRHIAQHGYDVCTIQGGKQSCKFYPAPK